jgi:hypothetical protein
MTSITVTTWLNERGWIMVPVTVCGVWGGNFVLSTIATTSTLSAGTASALDAFQCLSEADQGGLMLRGLTIGQQRLPDLPMRVSPAATISRVEGLLGLNFLRQFASVCFDVAGNTLTLDLP